MSDQWKTHCERYEKFLKEGGGQWLVGGKLSWADLFLAEVNDRILIILDEKALDSFPTLKEHCKRVHAVNWDFIVFCFKLKYKTAVFYYSF